MSTRERTVTIRTVLPWRGQVAQYPPTGEPGVSYFAGVLHDSELPPIDCLLWRDAIGTVRGILNHYAVDYPPHERAGNVNLFVQPGWERQGIGTQLWREAVRRWGVTLDQQRFTAEGVAFADYLDRTGA